MPGYQVMEYLGNGARSTIWRVRDRRTRKSYALKQVVKEPGDDSRFIDQALNEFNIAWQLDHANIRRCLRLRKIRRLIALRELHILMEFCEGKTCQANRPTETREVVRIFLAVAQALTHIHARGFVHADIKPNNIIVAGDGAVKIIDFGQSCRIGTIKERIQGTPDFIAPEQVHRKPLDGRTDVFNLGAALYWCLTGRPIPTILPKGGDSIQLVGNMRVTPPEQFNPDVPPALSRLVLDCIDPEISRRPQSARDISGRLDLIDHTLGPAHPPDRE